MSRKIWVIVPAAGRGSRFQSKLPKQYIPLAGRPVLAHTLNVFIECADVSEVIVALAEDDRFFFTLDKSIRPTCVSTVTGGNSRAQSVFNALKALQYKIKPDDFVLIHDAARPLLHSADLANLIQSLEHDTVGGILATPVVDTLKRAKMAGSGSKTSIETTISRENVWSAQTPQMFRFSILYSALKAALNDQVFDVTDEASAVEAAGYSPRLIAAKYSNPKVTYPEDMRLAEILLQERGQANSLEDEALL